MQRVWLFSVKKWFLPKARCKCGKHFVPVKSWRKHSLFCNQHTPWTADASVARRVVRAPVLFSCRSNQPISWRSMLARVNRRIRTVKFSPDIANIQSKHQTSHLVFLMIIINNLYLIGDWSLAWWLITWGRIISVLQGTYVLCKNQLKNVPTPIAINAQEYIKASCSCFCMSVSEKTCKMNLVHDRIHYTVEFMFHSISESLVDQLPCRSCIHSFIYSSIDWLIDWLISSCYLSIATLPESWRKTE